jgi:CRISPR/Cas system-associated endoribonuclease Cas2
MAELIEINDWVQHQRFKIRGQVKKIIRPDNDNITILKVWTSDLLPLQTWEEAHVVLMHKGDSKEP